MKEVSLHKYVENQDYYQGSGCCGGFRWCQIPTETTTKPLHHRPSKPHGENGRF